MIVDWVFVSLRCQSETHHL